MAKSYRFYEFSVLKCNSNESATKGDNAMSKKIRTEAVDYLLDVYKRQHQRKQKMWIS